MASAALRRLGALGVLGVLGVLGLAAGAAPAFGQSQAQQVGETNGITIIQLTGSYDTSLGGQANSDPRGAVAKEFFRTHPDDFDFLVVIPNFAFQSDDGIAFHWTVRSSVQGIGLAPFNNGAFYGSPGRLLGFVDMPALAQMETDPLQPGFETTLNALAHELMHQWGCFVHLRNPDGSLSNELLGLDLAHWSFLLDSRASVMYGNQWQDNGDGSFTSTAVRRFYSPLDLYLAGFYDASEVPPFLVITSPGTAAAQLPALGTTVSGTGRQVSVADVIAAEGPRVPPAAQAQHAFKAAFIFLTRSGDTVSADQLAAIDRVRRESMTHFAVLTGGRGTLEITDEAPPPPTGGPTPISGGPLRSTAASLADALTWLRGRQAADGSWQDTPATQPRDSAVVYSTLAALDPLFTPPSRQLAVGWLSARAANNADDLARLANAVGAAALRASLLAQANPDGGWGLGAGYGSEPVDTALAVQALAGQADTPAPALAAATRYLLASQVAGAGWGNVPGGASRTGATALVLEALKALGAVAANPAPVATALAWLASKQNADGGFGDSPSTAHDTAAALLAALDLGQGGAVRASDATTYLATHQSVEGSWEGSTHTTALVVTALDRSSLPNWTFGGPLVAAPAQPADGDRVAITVAVLSNGDVGAPAGVVRIYDGDPAAGGAPIGPDLAVPPLAPGQSANLTATWDTLGKAGSHTLVAVIDPDGRVAELSKADNQASLAITVAAAPAGVDLEVRSGDLAVNPPQPAGLPVQLAISAVVRNNGQTGVPAADVRLYLGTPAGGTVLGDVSVAVPGRSSAVANFVYTLTTPGTTLFTVVADPDNLIPETDKTNNAATVTVTTAAVVDLGLSAADIQLAGPAFLGNDATFHVTLHNFGTVDSPSAQVVYTVTDGTTTRTLPGSTVAIAAGGSVQETVVWRVDLTGNLTFTVAIHDSEPNQANNQASLAFTASAVSVPNLVIGRGDLTLVPDPGLQGQPLTATAVVHNSGGEDVAGVQVGLYDGDPQQGGQLIGGALQVVPSLPAGGSATVAATLASIPDASDHLIYAVADPGNQVAELTKDDNSTFVVLPVLSLPDAAITPGSLALQPAFPAPGQAVTLAITVTNLGQQPIPALLVRAYDGDPAQGGAAVGDQTIVLPGGGSAQTAIHWTLGGSSGPRSLFVVLDPSGAVVEASKANNTASLAIVVQQGDFTVSNRYFSPNGDGVQDTTELDFRLSGPATVSIQVADVHGKVLRTAGGAAYANVAGGSFVWDGRDDLGRVVADGDYVLAVVAADGTPQGQAVATVDTDRSPLLAAAGTPFADVVNLTCPLPAPGPFFYGADEQTIFFLENGRDPIFGDGVYSMPPGGGAPQQLVATSWFAGSEPFELVASADSTLLAFTASPPNAPAICPPAAPGLPPAVPAEWTVPSNGSAPPAPLGCDLVELLGFDPSGTIVYAYDSTRVLALPVSGAAPRTLFTLAQLAGIQGLGNPSLSPDRTLLLMPGLDANGNTGVWLVDLVAGGGVPLPVDGIQSFTWSPDSQKVAVSTAGTALTLVGRDGSVLSTLALPTDLPAFVDPATIFGTVGTGAGNVSWSSSGTALAAEVGYRYCVRDGGNVADSFSRIVTVDTTSGDVHTVAWSQIGTGLCIFQSFNVASWDGKSWVDRGALHFDGRQREQTLDLGRYLPGAKGEVRLRIRQTGYGEAQVDSVALLSGANRQAPTVATRRSDGKSLLAAVARRDHRLADLHEDEMEVVWKQPFPGPLRLALTASEGRPADFPAAVSAVSAGSPGVRPGSRSSASAGRAMPRAGAGAGAGTGPRAGPAPRDAQQLQLGDGHLIWAPFEQELALDRGDPSLAIDLDAGDAATPLLPQFQEVNLGSFAGGFSPIGRYMLFSIANEQQLPETCYQQDDTHIWMMRSLMNLTADLQVRQPPGAAGYLLEGTAADLHFLRYQLDYANALDPASWTPIAPPSSTPVLDGTFTTWVPPGPGSYLVRLTVQDLAGNSRTAVRRVSSSDSPPITGLSISPGYFSPNGDGVLDTATIHYQVLQPVHLDFRFFDANGQLVRTISQDHGEVGSAFDVVWDGRGDDGNVVPDGVYTVKVLSYELFVAVDTTPPAVDIDLQPARECVQGIDPVSHLPVLFVAYAPALAVTIDDASGIATQAIETGAGAAPAAWLPAVAGALTEAQFDGHSFRASATDLAGNVTVHQVPPGPEELFLTGIATKTIDPGTGALKPLPPLLCAVNPQLQLAEAVTRVQVGESILAPISQLFVETQAAPMVNGQPDFDPTHLLPNQWQAEAITAFYTLGSNAPLTTIPQSQFEIDWDLKNVVPGTETAARLHAIDQSGADHWSDPFYVHTAGVVLAGFLDSGDPQSVGQAIAGLLQQQQLAPPQDAVLVGLNFSSQALASVTLVMTSDQDPNFQAPRFYSPVASDGANYLFTSPDWRPCIKYRAHLVAVTAPLVDPGTGETVTLTFVTPDQVVERPCLSLSYVLEPEVPANPVCDTNLGTQRTLVLTPFSLDGSTLQLLSVNGPGGVLFSVSGPASSTQYSYSFDLAGRPAGILPLALRITNTAGQEWETAVNLYVENTPPVVAITSQPGGTVCRQAVLEGTVDDAGCSPSYHLDDVGASGAVPIATGTFPPQCTSPFHYQGPVGTVIADGSHAIRLVATNRGGFTACSAPVTVDVVSQIDSPVLTAAPAILSPNGDGVADTTILSVGAAEPTQATVVIAPALPGIGQSCTAVGVPVRSLAGNLPLANAATLAWDGRGDDGSVVPDGLYQAIATFQDSCGNQAGAVTCLTVDTTPPQLAIDYPQPGDPLALVVEARGLVADALSGVQGWSLEYGVGSDPQSWAGIATGIQPIGHDFLGAWNTFGLSGSYTLRLRAVDLVGNASEVRVPLVLAQRVQLITGLAAQPRLFSPNGDGRLDTTAVLTSLGAAATGTLAVQDGTGATVRSLLVNAPLPQGASSAVWDGATDGGQPAADGDYTMVLSVQAAANPNLTDRQSITVTLDRTPPAVTLTRPLAGGYVGPIGGVTGTISDPHLTSWSVSLTSTPQAPAWTQLANGTSSVAAGTLASLAGLAGGSYTLKVDAEDSGQIQVEQIIPFTVLATPPRATLATPAAGAILGGAGGLVAVTGSVVDDHLQDWRVELGNGAAPATWTALATGSTLPVPAPALAWNVSGVADGDYTLRLIADDLAAQTGEARAAITVDNTPPVVAIVSPADGGTVTGPTDVVGTVTDTHLVDYTLAVAPGPKTTATQFSPLGAGSTPVQGGRLLGWTALPPDGVATLRLTAVDRAGNQSTAYAQVTVHTRAPAAPQGLTAQVAQRDVHLGWLPNAETDLAGYRLRRNGALVTAQPIAGTAYVDPGLAEGTYTYTLTAVDTDGLESLPSAPAAAVIDLTAPTALIAQPHPGARAGGVVDVIGTAYSQNDFKEYRLYVTPADGSAPRQLLRSSPVPVQAALLAQWSTLGLTDGSSFVLRLEAEDLAGNVAAAEVTVTVDNTPPAAPSGLTATADGTTIHLAWNANGESDLAGYLLYRNGKLANAVGPVVGDLTPYLLTGTAFDDLSLPDGTFVYVLYAVDQAGNQSPPSPPAQASLDNHPPHVTITQPAPGALFQDSLDIVGTTPDLDVASVQFQWQPAGAAGWNDLGAALTAPPWEVIWSTAAIAYGDYLLRAVATDLGGRTDPAPAAVPVTHKNLTRPPAPAGLAAAVAGGTVTLTWTAGTPAAPDLVGYLVTRTAADGTATQLTASPVAATSYADAGVADGTYGYAVVALNQAGNASDPAGPQTAVVYSLALTQPYTPTVATVTGLAGSGAAAGAQVAGTDTGPGGGTPIAAVAADGAGNFTFTALPLARGDNQLAVAASDAAGNTSKTAGVPVFTADPPAQPTGLAASVDGANVVQLTWNGNPAADGVLGYRLTRDGNPQPLSAAVDGPLTAASAGTTPNGPANAIDGNSQTYWAPVAGADPDLRNQWLELDWPLAEQVARIEIDWASETRSDGTVVIHNAGDYQLEGWDGRVWVPLARQSGDSVAATRVTPALPYLTNRVRLRLLPTSAMPWVAEMRIYQYPLTATPAASDAPGGGSHSYQVIAVGPVGIESLPSAPATATVGTPPAAVTLSGTANGSEVDLSWTPSTSPNIAYYLVLREGAPIAQVTDPSILSYADAGRPDGTWHYTVEAVDQLGNVSAPSNVVAVTVAVALLPAPAGLTVAVVPAGGALDLSWTAVPAAAAPPGGVVYEIERGTVQGGPYQVVGTTPAPPYRDSGLTNGRTYYYVVAAVDALGNVGAPSNEASGTPADTTPPDPPVLHFPARSTLAFVTTDPTADLVGTAEAGATLVLVPTSPASGDGGSRSTQASAAAAVADSGALSGQLVPSPDGRYLLVSQNGGGFSLYDFDAAGGPSSISLTLGAGVVPAGWMADGRGLLLLAATAAGSEVRSYRFAGAAQTTLAALDAAAGAVAAPDGERLAVLGSRGGQAGIWVLDPAAGSWDLLAAVDPNAVSGVVWSPEGSAVAYVGPQPPPATGSGLVVVATTAPHAAVLIEPNPGSGRAGWTLDGSAVIYSELDPATGNEQARRTALADGSTVALTAVLPGPLLPAVSPDGKQLAYAANGAVVVADAVPVGSGGAGPVPLAQTAPGDLWWVPGGYVLAVAGDVLRIAPAGRFAFASVALSPGDNSFTATARDAAGNVSAASAPRVIHLGAAALPNLAIAAADLALLPAAPLAGQTVRVSATVHNTGTVDAPATSLALTAYGPGGAQVSLAAALPVPAIPAGGAASVSQDGAVPGPAGPWTLVAQVDPEGLVQETTRSDDQAQVAFQVVTQGPPVVTVTTDQAAYQPNATLTSTVTVFNGSAVFSGQVLVTIEDAQGFAVTTLPAIAVDQLGYAQQLTRQATWNVGSTLAGSYLVDVKLQDGQGNTVAEATAPFAIVTVAQLTAAVTTDEESYPVGASVHIATQIGYPSGNAPLAGVSVHLQVVTGGGPGGTPPPTVAGDWTLPLGTLLPGGQATVAVDWASGGAATGAYQVTAAVLDGGQVLASAATPFSLTGAAAAVTGTLALANRAPSWGQALAVTYTLHNGGAAALSQVPVRVRVLDAATAQELARQAAAFDLPAGGGAGGGASFDTGALGLGNRLAVLEADLPAGGAGGGIQTVTLATVGFTVVDRTPPTVTVIQPAAGATVGSAFAVQATALDPLSIVTAVQMSLDGGAWQAASPLDPAAGSYQLLLSGIAAGAHGVRAQATDAAGNAATSTAIAFTVAVAPPVIAITGVQDGGLYNGPVTPVVTITAATATFSAALTLDGQPYASGTAVTAEGNHTLAVTVTDAVGNQASAAVGFAIDTTPPVITVTGVSNGGLYGAAATPVTPVVTVSDAHPGTQAITLNGQAFASGTAVAAEGSYTLIVTATDAAGNQASLTVGFVIDKTPPVIAVTGVSNGGLYGAAATPVTPVVTVTDAHPGTQTITLNGQAFVSGTAVTAEGSYTLVVTATDAAGNQASLTVGFAIDETPPVITVSGVSNGATYGAPVTPVVTVSDSHPGTQTITLNGQPFVSGTTVAAAGSYQLQIAAVDAAGNQAQAAVAFTIGAAVPALSIADVTVTSPGSGSVAARFTVSLSAPAAGTVTVGFATAGGTAIDGIDFIPAGGTLSFAPGTTLQTVSVPVLADPLLLSAATFTVQLAGPQGANLARAAATGTILPATACTSVNLLANPDAEQPSASNLIPGWDVVAGSAWQVSGGPPVAFAGDDDFATSDAAGELKQDVDLQSYGAQIASAAGQSFAFTGQLRTADAGGGAPASTARIVVEYRDATNQTVLGSFDSGALSSPQGWQQVGDQRQAPSGARWLRVRLLSGLPAGGGGAAYFDGLSLVSVQDPTLAVLDAAVATPAAGQRQAFSARVVLSCAASQTVTVHYATVDDTAVAGTDYLAASGSLVFSPGSVEQDVALVALGLASDQVDRAFDLALTQPVGAVVARAQAEVRLLPRPFCAQPPSYWRHHQESWTFPSVSVGGIGYDQGGALWLLGYGGADPLALLAQQTAATRLDLAAGAPAAGQTPAANADAFLEQHPLGTVLGGSDAQTAANLTAALAAYDSAACPLVCSADPLGVAGRFNLFALGNVTQSGTDTAGRLAAAGNVTLSNYSVGQSLTATGGDDDVLIAGGALSFTGGTVSHGNVVYGGTVGLTSVSVPNGSARQDAPVDFAGASRALTILSSYWASLAVNGTTTVQPWKQIQLAGNSATLNVFSVHGSDLAVAVGLSIQVPAGSTALVNVDGASDKMQNFGFQLTGVANGQVFLNFYQATSLSISGIGVPGTVMAPRAAISFNNGNVNGTLIGASVAGGGQSNQYLFTGCLPVGN